MRNIHIKALSVFILVLIFSAAYTHKVQAFRELPADTDELARSSEDVVVAKCVKSEVREEENTGFIFTYTTFRVDESLKGQYGDEIVIRVIGGDTADTQIKVPDAPRFNPDEEVVLFLGPRNSKGYPVIKSTRNGVFRIKTDEEGRKVVSRSSAVSAGGDTSSRASVGSKVYLDDFLNSISNSID